MAESCKTLPVFILLAEESIIPEFRANEST